MNEGLKLVLLLFDREEKNPKNKQILLIHGFHFHSGRTTLLSQRFDPKQTEW